MCVPGPEAQPQFVRDPKLVQMVADAQNKKQEEEEEQMDVEEVEVEENSGSDSADSFWL